MYAAIGVWNMEAGDWQEWPPGRCADPRAHRILPSRRALLFTYFLKYRARFLSLAAPLHILQARPSPAVLARWDRFGADIRVGATNFGFTAF